MACRDDQSKLQDITPSDKLWQISLEKQTVISGVNLQKDLHVIGEDELLSIAL